MYPNMYLNKMTNKPEPQSPVVETSDYNVDILKQFMDCLGESIVNHDILSRHTHVWGLHGQKRWHRYYCNKFIKMLQKIQHYAIDMYDVNIEANMEETENNCTDISKYFDCCIEKTKNKIDKVSDMYNVCVNSGYIEESCFIKDYLDDLTCQLKHYNRWLKDFSKADWNWAYIRVVDDRLHNKFEIKEAEENGYKD